MSDQNCYSLKLNYINGLPFPTFIDEKRMDELKDWTLLPDDVYVVTYPKSGTTWAQQILKLIRNNGVDDGVTIGESVPWLERVGPEKCKVNQVCAHSLHNSTCNLLDSIANDWICFDLNFI